MRSIRRRTPSLLPTTLCAVALLAAACGGPSVTASAQPSPVPVASPTAPSTPIPSEAATPSFPGTEPVLGQTFGLVYDPVLERVVLVNGATESGPVRPTELWAWDGTTWELIDAAGPPARSFSAVARDPVRGVVVVHGGIGSDGDAFDETLEWDGRDWTIHEGAGAGPGPREGAGMAHHGAAGQLVLFGGSTRTEQPTDTWAWDGVAWTRLAEAGPRGRFVSLLAESREFDWLILQGGHWVDGNDGGFLADTWRWDGETWTELERGGPEPGPRVNSPGAWDDGLDAIVLFGGGTGFDNPMAADTWIWSGSWMEVGSPGPGARNGHAMAWDERREVLVLVGGIDRPGGTQALDVWERDGEGWHEVTPGS